MLRQDMQFVVKQGVIIMKNHYLSITTLSTSFIFAPFPTCPKKKGFFPQTSKASSASLYSACNFKQTEH